MRLAAWGLQNGLRHMDMAKKFGLSESTVGKLCTGSRRPSLRTIERIERATDGAVGVFDWYEGREPAPGEPGQAVTNFAELPERHFGVVYADPPWHFRTRSDKGRGRSPDKHYKCMSLADIEALPVSTVCLPDCHLFMWVPAAHLIEGLALMNAWGFFYSSTGFIWVKLRRGIDRLRNHWFADDIHNGLGMTTRKGAELCLLGRRGQPARLSKAISEVIVSPVRKHSRKPDEARARIEGYASGPYLELFARSVAPGWTAFGDQIGPANVYDT